jgi:hypothetical protein
METPCGQALYGRAQLGWNPAYVICEFPSSINSGDDQKLGALVAVARQLPLSPMRVLRDGSVGTALAA